MKKLIVTDPVWICGSDLTSGTSDEKCKCMGYDSTALIAYITITNTTVCTVVVVQHLPVPQRLVVSCFKCPLVLSIVAPKFQAQWPQWRWNNYIIQLSRLILKGLLSSPFLSIIIQLTHQFCTTVIVVIPHTCTHSSVCTVEIVHCVLL